MERVRCVNLSSITSRPYLLLTVSCVRTHTHTHTHTHTSRCVVSDVCAGAGVRHVPIVSECKCMSGCYRLPHYQEVTVYRTSLSDEQEEGEGEREGEEEGEEEREGEGEGEREGEGKEGESEGEREEGEEERKRRREGVREEEGEGEEGRGRAVGQGESDSHEIIDMADVLDPVLNLNSSVSRESLVRGILGGLEL